MQLKEFDGKCTMEQCMDVYKIILFPEDVMKIYLKSLDERELKKIFREEARKIHPDKNSHHKAA